jgi:hypothetical protein
MRIHSVGPQGCHQQCCDVENASQSDRPDVGGGGYRHVLIEGVHGPRRLDVIIVGSATATS